MVDNLWMRVAGADPTRSEVVQRAIQLVCDHNSMSAIERRLRDLDGSGNLEKQHRWDEDDLIKADAEESMPQLVERR